MSTASLLSVARERIVQQSLDDASDGELLDRVGDRDRRAFEVLYHRYHRRLFGYLLRLTAGRVEMVEEVLNDAMLVVWRSASDFRGRSRVSTWVFGIAYRKALKALARRKRQRETNEDEAPEPVAPGGPEHDLDRGETARAVSAALASLPAEQRAVVELTYYRQLPYREIAEIVGCPVNTVKTRMFHARRRLRELLPGLGVDGGDNRQEGAR